MKNFLPLLLAIFCLVGFQKANAQLADGSIAPDFTLTDINGNSHTLYDYLDQGYTVVLDFSATWCGPCWNYHISGALEDLYMNHGPAGMPNVAATTTDDVMVFMVEGDGNTTAADLNGTGSSTQGDWVTGTPYPIIDDASITGLYQIGYWPTIYTVCPNRIISESGQAGTAAHYNNVADCPVATAAADISLVDFQGTGIICDGEGTVQVRMQNLGLDPLTAATIEVMDGATLLTSYTYAGNLPTYGLEVVDLGAISLASTTNVTITATITNDGDVTNNSINQTMTALTGAATATQNLTFNLTTDNYGYETSWEIVSSSGVQLAFGDGYASSSNYSIPVSIPDGECFKFSIYDDYGDGICCTYGNGSYQLIDDAGTVLASGGSFTDLDESFFTTVSCSFAVDLTSTDDDGSGNGTATVTFAGGVAPFTITWNDASNQTTGTATGLTAGTYEVTIIDADGCLGTQTVVVGLSTNVKAVEGLSALTLYPNPVSNNFFVEFSLNNTVEMNVAIYNTVGQLIQSVGTETYAAGQNLIEINAAELANGIYMVRLNSTDGMITKRFTVNK